METTKPKVYVATPCYDSMRVETCVSLIDMFSTLGKHGIECTFKTMRTCYITHARNMLTCAFLNSNYDYLLFVDADVEFNPEAVLRMLVPKMDIICTPYRVKNKPEVAEYTVSFPDPECIKILPWDLVEISEGPAGLMLIHRRVFERLMEKYPEMKCNFPDEARAKFNREIGTESDAAAKYLWNFWGRLLKMAFIRVKILLFVIYAPRLDLKFTRTSTQGPRITDHMAGRDDLVTTSLRRNEA